MFPNPGIPIIPVPVVPPIYIPPFPVAPLPIPTPVPISTNVATPSIPGMPVLEKLPAPGSRPPNPTSTVFVGNINENAPDILVRNILSKIGLIISWKRVQGVTGKLQGFGFCEYDDPEATLRAIRLLNNFDLGGKKLMVKVDAKSKEKLREYKLNRRREISGTVAETLSKSDDILFKPDVNAIKRDHNIMSEIKRLIRDNPDLNKKVPETSELEVTKEKLTRTHKMDAEKTEVISKEILKFKENNAKDDVYREKVRERERERREHEKLFNTNSNVAKTTNLTAYKHGRDSPDSDHEDLHERKRSRRSRSRSPISSSRRNETERRIRFSRSRSHSGGPINEPAKSNAVVLSREEREAIRREHEARERERELAQQEEAERQRERRKLERKLREKEASYQEQLRVWEMRENKKLRDYHKQKQYEEYLKEEELAEAKRLKEFLEDYIDERDDPKYYKGAFLSRRLKEREKEMELDLRDRQKEKEEIEEIKQRLCVEGAPNLEEELAKLEKSRSQHLKPQLRLEQEMSDENEVKETSKTSSKHKNKSNRESKSKRHKSKSSSPQPMETDITEINTQKDLTTTTTVKSFVEIETLSTPEQINGPPKQIIDIDDVKSNSEDENAVEFVSHLQSINETKTTENGFDANAQPFPEPQYKPIGFKTIQLEKKVTNVESSMFGGDDEETQAPKKKLVPLIDETSNDTPNQIINGNANNSAISVEEKRQAIKRLIEKIPTNKSKLFAYKIEWDLVDNILMEKRIKPWINKKIIEYIGEEEPTLVEFICTKLIGHNDPQSILDDILMVLDEEAEVFIIKLWRLLIYEIEAKRSDVLKSVTAD